ncbi:MAG: hypothetical protein HGA36_02210 [Candidatus Moranbacteria bacterium]|nr:hypothetical protein [Candidatus Moranbacteria bacterium]
MLNYILPPIIIVISISILIMFLFRKAAQIPAGEFAVDEDNGRNHEKNATKMMSGLGQFGLKILERLMHHSKLLSLKFHNVSNVWFQTIREKRKQSAQLQKDRQAQQEEQVAFSRKSNLNVDVQADSLVLQERQTLRPMVRSTMTMPQKNNAKEKNQLEDTLIKRIAINPKDIEAYERLGDYYLESENFGDSLECFKQVLKLSPAHHKARLRIRRLEKLK